jgi:hypothetical protein
MKSKKWLLSSLEKKMKKFKEYIKNKDDKKQKIEMYFDYYKNLSPKNFKVKKEKNKIVIELL